MQKLEMGGVIRWHEGWEKIRMTVVPIIDDSFVWYDMVWCHTGAIPYIYVWCLQV